MPALDEPSHELNDSDDNRQNPSALETENQSVVAHLQLHVQFQRNVIVILFLLHEYSFFPSRKADEGVFRGQEFDDRHFTRRLEALGMSVGASLIKPWLGSPSASTVGGP